MWSTVTNALALLKTYVNFGFTLSDAPDANYLVSDFTKPSNADVAGITSEPGNGPFLAFNRQTRAVQTIADLGTSDETVEHLVLDGHLLGGAVPLHSFQVGQDFGRALVAQLAVFLQTLMNDPLQLQRQIGIQSRSSECSCRE